MSRNLDDHYIYVFVRQDISLPEQLVHVGHVAYHGGNLTPEVTGIPSVIVVGVPHIKALDKVLKKLSDNNIPHYSWQDPDLNYGVTAIATVPLNPQQKTVLANYRLWNNSLGTAKAACLLTQDEGAKAPIAQLREHPVFNGEVVGENPSGGSK